MFLEKRGLQIREKNFRCRSGEIDLIAQDERYLVFVEVKYRKNGRSGSSFAAVGREKQRIISRVAMFYLAVHGYREFRSYEQRGLSHRTERRKGRVILRQK